MTVRRPVQRHFLYNGGLTQKSHCWFAGEKKMELRDSEEHLVKTEYRNEGVRSSR